MTGTQTVGTSVEFGTAHVVPLFTVSSPMSSRQGEPVTAPRSRPGRESPRPMTVRTDDGVTLDFTVHGPRNASCAVVFLHGLYLSQGSWASQIDSVIDTFGLMVHAVRYGHRGHGRSTAAPAASYTIDRLADDLDEVLSAVAPTGPVVAIGHSMGAMAALTLCGRRAASNTPRVAGLVLAATAAGHLTQFGLGQLLTAPGSAPRAPPVIARSHSRCSLTAGSCRSRPEHHPAIREELPIVT